MSSMVMDGVAGRSRKSDPVTSVDAGRVADLPGSQTAVMVGLSVLGPMTDHQISHSRLVAEYGYTEQRLRSARSELVEQGLVKFAGFYRPTPSGRRAQVWKAVA